MSNSVATLIAASIAASVSLISLLMHATFGRNSEARAAHRQLLAEHLTDLASSVAEVVATANVLNLVAKEGSTREKRLNWQTKGEAAVKRLKCVRPKVRYPLYGLDDGLRTLSRIPHWTASYTGKRADNGSRVNGS